MKIEKEKDDVNTADESKQEVPLTELNETKGLLEFQIKGVKAGFDELRIRVILSSFTVRLLGSTILGGTVLYALIRWVV